MGRKSAAVDNSAAQERAAKAALEASARAAVATTQAAADEQRNIAEREKIAADARATADTPTETVEVAVDAPGVNSAASTKRRKATFSANYTSASTRI